MVLEIRVKGLSQAIARFGGMSLRLKSAIGDAIKESALTLEGEAKKALTVGPTRAILTGRLRSDTVVRTLTKFSATIYPTVNYAVFIHEGTSKMRARPFMKVAVDNSKNKIEKIFNKRIRSVLI